MRYTHPNSERRQLILSGPSDEVEMLIEVRRLRRRAGRSVVLVHTCPSRCFEELAATAMYPATSDEQNVRRQILSTREVGFGAGVRAVLRGEGDQAKLPSRVPLELR